MTQPAIKIVIAKPGLDGHDVGAKVVCRALIDAGMDVVYAGLRNSPEAIAELVAKERPAVLGLSILSGAHLPLTGKVVDALEQRGLGNVLLIAGGNIPAGDHSAMTDLGVAAVFPTSTPFQSIVSFIENTTQAGASR
ncbi:MAG: cobalamin-dependent protein [Planctomycetota bacterium]|jgi:methylmalonyl-CoA mutase C-terminal domain/subunit|nr:methylmalonyl-CoA mutase [Candidatus Woesearchaeota archaeon]MDP6386494.1 cobalamin-dependent protein [Planctomycetota bacterium]